MNNTMRSAILSAMLLSCTGDHTSAPDSGPELVPDSGLELLDNGSACTSDGACASGMCVQAYGDGESLPGGLCTDTCEWDMSLEDFTRTCGDGETCLKYAPSDELLCYQDCSADSDCRQDGWWCLCWDYHCSEGARGSCVPDWLGSRW